MTGGVRLAACWPKHDDRNIMTARSYFTKYLGPQQNNFFLPIIFDRCGALAACFYDRGGPLRGPDFLPTPKKVLK